MSFCMNVMIVRIIDVNMKMFQIWHGHLNLNSATEGDLGPFWVVSGRKATSKITCRQSDLVLS
jgi:hypothetical protein